MPSHKYLATGEINKEDVQLVPSIFFPAKELEDLQHNQQIHKFVDTAKSEMERFCALRGAARGDHSENGSAASAPLSSHTHRTAAQMSHEIRIPVQWLRNHLFDVSVTYRPIPLPSKQQDGQDSSPTPKVTVYTNDVFNMNGLSAKAASQYALLATPEGRCVFLNAPTVQISLKGSLASGNSVLERSLVDELLFIACGMSAGDEKTPSSTLSHQDRLASLFNGVTDAVQGCNPEKAVLALKIVMYTITRAAFKLAFILNREYLWCSQNGAGIVRSCATPGGGGARVPTLKATSLAVRAELSKLPNAGYTFGYDSGADASIMSGRLMRLSVFILQIGATPSSPSSDQGGTLLLLPCIRGELLLDLNSFVSAFDDPKFRTYPALTSMGVSSSGSARVTIMFPISAPPGIVGRMDDGGRITRHVEAFLCLYDETSMMVRDTQVKHSTVPVEASAALSPLPPVAGAPVDIDSSKEAPKEDATLPPQLPTQEEQGDNGGANFQILKVEEEVITVVDEKEEEEPVPVVAVKAEGRFFGGVCNSRRQLPFAVSTTSSLCVTLKQHNSGRTVVEEVATNDQKAKQLAEELQAIVRGSIEPFAFTLDAVSRYQRLDATDGWLWVKSSETLMADASTDINIGIAVAPPMPLSCALVPATIAAMPSSRAVTGNSSSSVASLSSLSPTLSPRTTSTAGGPQMGSVNNSPGRGGGGGGNGGQKYASSYAVAPTSANISEVTVSSQLCGMEIASKTPLAWPLHTGLIAPFTAGERQVVSTATSEDPLDLIEVPLPPSAKIDQESMLNPYVTDVLVPSISMNLLGEATTFLLLIKTLSQRCPTYFSNLVRFNTKLRDEPAASEIVTFGDSPLETSLMPSYPASTVTRCRVASFLCDSPAQDQSSPVAPMLVTVYFYGSTVMKTVRGGYYVLPVTVQLCSTKLTIRGEGAVRPVRTSCHPLPVPQSVVQALQTGGGGKGVAHTLSPTELSDIIIGGVERKVGSFLEVCRGCSEHTARRSSTANTTTIL